MGLRASCGTVSVYEVTRQLLGFSGSHMVRLHEPPADTSLSFPQWDLVCEHKSLKSIAQSIYMTGQLVGAIAFGIFSDR